MALRRPGFAYRLMDLDSVALIAMVIGGGIVCVLGLVYVVGTSSRRSLPDKVVEEIGALPPYRNNQHLVDLQLSNGSWVRRVYIAYGRYPAFSIRRLFKRWSTADVVHVRLPDNGPANTQ